MYVPSWMVKEHRVGGIRSATSLGDRWLYHFQMLQGQQCPVLTIYTFLKPEQDFKLAISSFLWKAMMSISLLTGYGKILCYAALLTLKHNMRT